MFDHVPAKYSISEYCCKVGGYKRDCHISVNKSFFNESSKFVDFEERYYRL